MRKLHVLPFARIKLSHLLTLLIVSAFQFPTVAAAAENEKPNIILYIADDMSWPELSMSGNPIIQTPHIDKLAEQSLRFRNFQVAPTCSPTRAQMMSGRHEFAAGVTHTILGRNKLRDDVKILPQYLKDAGYQTGMFGKWHLGGGQGLTGKPLNPDGRGFDTAIWTGNQLGRFDPRLMHNGKMERFEGYCGDVVFEQAMKWVDELEGEAPFFAYVSTSIPHVPIKAPQEYMDIYKDAGLTEDEQGYYAMVSVVDDNIGRLMEWLDTKSFRDNTIVIFMTDNGHAISGPRQTGLGVDGLPEPGALYNAGFRGGKTQSWNGTTCVPFFVRWPNHTKEGDIDTFSSAKDLLPTFAELAGVEVEDANVTGYSLVADFKGEASAIPSNRVLVSHVGRWKESDQLENNKYYYASIFTDQYRLTWGHNKKPELFDYKNDRGEREDILSQHPELAEQLKKQYDGWWEDVKKEMVNDLALMEQSQ
jgi:arylsulfatase